jgi:hypothetical protein
LNFAIVKACAISSWQVHPNATAFEVSANYAATQIRFTRIPSGAGQVDWHTVPERVLTVRLDGSAEYQTRRLARCLLPQVPSGKIDANASDRDEDYRVEGRT